MGQAPVGGTQLSEVVSQCKLTNSPGAEHSPEDGRRNFVGQSADAEMPLITPYGRDNAVVLLGISVLIAGGGIAMGEALGWGLGIGGGLLAGLTLWFFRDPERALPPEAGREGAIVAPADGQIVQLCRRTEPEFIRGEAVQISIFLSVLDVHVNRIPVSGVVRLCRYIPGRFRAAFRPEASWQNEQMLIGIESSNGRVLFKQITGVLARRIVCTLHEGQAVRAGERFGMMKFGSRIDIFLPAERVHILVRERMRVRAGETIIGYLLPRTDDAERRHEQEGCGVR